MLRHTIHGKNYKKNLLTIWISNRCGACMSRNVKRKTWCMLSKQNTEKCFVTIPSSNIKRINVPCVNATTGIRKQVLSTTVCKSIMMIINQWKFRRGKRKKGRCQVLRVTYKYYVWPTSTTCDLQVLRVTYKYYVWPTSSTHFPMLFGQQSILLKKPILNYWLIRRYKCCLPSLGRDTREKGLLWNSHLFNEEYYVSMLLSHLYAHCPEYHVWRNLITSIYSPTIHIWNMIQFIQP